MAFLNTVQCFTLIATPLKINTQNLFIAVFKISAHFSEKGKASGVIFKSPVLIKILRFNVGLRGSFKVMIDVQS